MAYSWKFLKDCFSFCWNYWALDLLIEEMDNRKWIIAVWCLRSGVFSELFLLHSLFHGTQWNQSPASVLWGIFALLLVCLWWSSGAHKCHNTTEFLVCGGNVFPCYWAFECFLCVKQWTVEIGKHNFCISYCFCFYHEKRGTGRGTLGSSARNHKSGLPHCLEFAPSLPHPVKHASPST